MGGGDSSFTIERAMTMHASFALCCGKKKEEEKRENHQNFFFPQCTQPTQANFGVPFLFLGGIGTS